MGLEPMISRTTIWRANQLHHTHHTEPGGIRTLDLRLRRPLLYPAELQTRINFIPVYRLLTDHSARKRVMGIEPTYPAWKAGVLPLNYTREVGVTGFEPATSWSQTRRSSQAEPHPESIVFHYTFKTSYKVQESNVFGQALDRLVTVSSMCCHTSTSALSTL